MLICELIIQSFNLPCSLGALVSALVPGGFGASSHLSERWQPGGESWFSVTNCLIWDTDLWRHPCILHLYLLNGSNHCMCALRIEAMQLLL